MSLAAVSDPYRQEATGKAGAWPPTFSVAPYSAGNVNKLPLGQQESPQN